MAEYLAQNLVEVTLSGGINASQTTVTLESGEGARLASTSGSTYQYPLVIYDTRYVTPHDAHKAGKAEVVLVTSHDGSSDTISAVTRGQESTSAIAHNTSGVTYKAVAGLTKAMFDALGGEGVLYQTAPTDALAAAALGANPIPYSALQVVVVPIILQAQTINNLCFNVTNSSFVQLGGTPYLAVGLYNSSGSLLIDGTWKDVEDAGNKSTALGTSVAIKSGMYYLAWAGKFTSSGNLFTRAYESTTRIPFGNFDGFQFAIAANAATAPTGAGSAAMPSTLGALSDPSSEVRMPVVIFTT